VGQVAIVGDPTGLRNFDFQNGQRPLKIEKDWKRDDGGLKPAIDQLTACFSGELRWLDLSEEEVASVIAFLASDEAAAIHGAVYLVDRGKTVG
jgi:NAD(P)-dependent dehydrogenase (short-subunit alcohol dehydrogenase family)